MRERKEGRRGGGEEGRRGGGRGEEKQNDIKGDQLVVYGDGEVLCTHFVPLATR